MTQLSKRSLIKAAGWTVLAAVAGLAGCGKKEEAPAAAASAAPAPASAASVAAAMPDPLKVAFIYIGPVGDGGWTFAHDNGRKAVEKHFGDKVVTTFVEKVPESADAERVFRDVASQGNKLIFGTTFGYMEPMLKTATDLKDVKFEHGTGYKTAENMRTYDSRTYEGAYMAGVIAGGMTKTNTLGVVGSIPIPEVIRNINSFTLGAQSVNPKVKTKVVWVNEWFNPPKETEAAQSLINAGAERAEVLLLAGVQVADQPALAERVVAQFVGLHQRRDALVHPVAARPRELDLVVEPHRQPGLDGLAGFIGQLEVYAGVEFVDVLVQRHRRATYHHLGGRQRRGRGGRCQHAHQQQDAAPQELQRNATRPARAVAHFQRQGCRASQA